MLKAVCSCGLLLLFVTAGIVAQPLTPTASADRIVPLSIAGVMTGMTRHKVRSILGPPRRAVPRRGTGGNVFELEWRYRDRLSVAFKVDDGHRIRRVYRIRTKSPRDRFRKGVHVGVRARVLHRLRGLECQKMTRGSTLYPRGVLCTWYPNWVTSVCDPHLEFYLRNRRGRVKYIELSGYFETPARVNTVRRDGC